VCTAEGRGDAHPFHCPTPSPLHIKPLPQNLQWLGSKVDGATNPTTTPSLHTHLDCGQPSPYSHAHQAVHEPRGVLGSRKTHQARRQRKRILRTSVVSKGGPAMCPL
jgi:hypothetical protein